MGLIKNDLESMTPSFGVSNGAVNFSLRLSVTSTNTPLIQSLAGSGYLRTNVLEEFFFSRAKTQRGRASVTWWILTSTNYFNSALPFFHRARTVLPPRFAEPQLL